MVLPGDLLAVGRPVPDVLVLLSHAVLHHHASRAGHQPRGGAGGGGGGGVGGGGPSGGQPGGGAPV